MIDTKYTIKIKSGNKEGSISNIINLVNNNLQLYSKCDLVANNELSSKLTTVIEIIKRKLGTNNLEIKYNLITSNYQNINTEYSLTASIELIDKNINLSILNEVGKVKTIKKYENSSNIEQLNKNLELFN
jgi:hypothetical protein